MLNSATMHKTRSAVLLGAAAVLGLAIFVYLIPGYSPYYSIDSRLTRGEARQISRDVAAKLGVNLHDGLMENTTFIQDAVALTYLENKAGMQMANRLVKSDSLSMNRWDVLWFDQSKQMGESEKFMVQLSQTGKLLDFRRYIPDSLSGSFIDEASARTTLNSYWNEHDLSALTGIDLSTWVLKTSEPVRLEHRQDWRFTFVRDNKGVYGLVQRVTIRVSGGSIISMETRYVVPDDFRTLFTSWTQPYIFLTFFSWVIIFVLFAIGLVVFLKRYNEGEAGIGSALFVGSAYGVAASAAIILSFPSISSGVMIGSLNLFLKALVVLAAVLVLWTPLVGILTFSAWGIGESSARALWPEKLFTFDAVSHLKFFNEKVGASILRGYAFAGIILGLYAVAHPLFSVRGVVVSSGTTLDTYLPSLEALTWAFAMGLFCETIYRFGFLSYFGNKKLTTGILVSAVLFIPSLFYELPYGEYLTVTRTLFTLGLSAAMIFLFLRYDFLTVLTTSVLFLLARQVIPIFNSSNTFFEWNSAFVIFVLAIPVVIAYLGILKKQHFELTVDLMPRHIKRISERERMAKELEIAKSVQNNLLPKTTPTIPYIEFGGICIPALEVGGDYYDFIQMPNGLIGIAIADVSGKGLPAAIYMTLTKGVLQASAENQPSPKSVLSKINQIMYRSIPRGTFISMIYAVVDTKSNKVRFARAGHNPLALFSSGNDSAKLYTPNGLALGLDNGDKFDATLDEMEIDLKTGDLLVFYTDGFTEAMDSQAKEFGEESLVRLIESTRHLGVGEMIERIESGVRRFTGSAPQHDDMTMVAMKITGNNGVSH